MSKTALLIFTVICILGGYDFAVVYIKALNGLPSISSLFVDMHYRAQFSINVICIIIGHCIFPTVRIIEVDRVSRDK